MGFFKNIGAELSPCYIKVLDAVKELNLTYDDAGLMEVITLLYLERLIKKEEYYNLMSNPGAYICAHITLGRQSFSAVTRREEAHENNILISDPIMRSNRDDFDAGICIGIDKDESIYLARVYDKMINILRVMGFEMESWEKESSMGDDSSIYFPGNTFQYDFFTWMRNFNPYHILIKNLKALRVE